MKRFVLIFLMVLLSGPAWCGWELVPPMPHARYGHDAALGTDGRIYVMGGLVVEDRGP
jgi:hypothetical protein